MQNILDVLDQQIEKMASLDHTTPKIIGLTNDLNSETKDLVRTIQMDPVLTAKILKLVNSSFFGLKGHITSLSRAVILLGINTIKHIALTTCIFGSFKSSFRSKQLSAEEFWTYTMGTAVFAQSLSRHLNLNRQETENIFLIGLLHSIGIAFLMQFYPEEYEEILKEAKDSELPLPDIEKAKLGVSHLEVSARLCSHWKMPDWLIDGVRYYYDPLESELKTTLVVGIASIMLKLNNVGCSGDFSRPYPSDEIWDKINFKHDKAQEILNGCLNDELKKANTFIKGF